MLNRITQAYKDFCSDDDEVIETTPIDGLFWIKNRFFKSAPNSRIIIPNPNQNAYSIIYHGKDFSGANHGGYEFYGIHLGQDDVLSFLTYDDRLIKGHFVDCRNNSKTLHQEASLEYKGSPDKSLIIPRGVAHIFDNLADMTSLNQARHFIDIYNKDFNRSSDVINVPRGTPISEFPTLNINRFKAPAWIVKMSLRLQRINAKKKSEYPFNILRDGKIKTVYPK
ncbi:dTDP-4-dehydrorhamnose 3,5-epimerase family protein [Pseudomonas sp. 273]|uniref:dTDP-4-dehydrorhamnose 3,5-epimerase family protein n=1 Tax=Pseudomonas sp. 273 TaxID=75692 RepID=UPI0023D8C1CB|nr:dTDP-4-dehydrorhamnose 3,5-epimerase family protein [Pseudomonas sp. 273]